MQTTLPPFALPPLAFPFRHLAAFAGRAPIGGAREVALGCFLAARLASDRVSGGAIAELALSRTTGARSWLATLALPSAVRTPLTNCFELTAAGTTADLAAGLAALAAAAAGYLDPGARSELDLLAARVAA